MTRGKGHNTTPEPEMASADSVHFRKIKHVLFDINVNHGKCTSRYWFYKIY